MLNFVARRENSFQRKIAILSRNKVGFSSRRSHKASSMTTVRLRGRPPLLGGALTLSKIRVLANILRIVLLLKVLVWEPFLVRPLASGCLDTPSRGRRGMETSGVLNLRSNTRLLLLCNLCNKQYTSNWQGCFGIFQEWMSISWQGARMSDREHQCRDALYHAH